MQNSGGPGQPGHDSSDHDHDHDHDHDAGDDSGYREPGSTDGPGELSPLERAALAAILAGDEPMKVALRAQLRMATATSRTHSGVGFMTKIAVAAEAQAPSGPGSLRPAYATHPFLAEPAEFILQVRDGRLAVLEGYCFAGVWPTDESSFRVTGP